MRKKDIIYSYLFLTFLLFLALFLVLLKNNQFSNFSLSTSYTILKPSSEEKTLNTFSQNNLKNFLFLGIAGEGSRGAYLTDTIIISAINPEKKKITLISLPRDLLVKVPHQEYSVKINALFDLENPNKKIKNKTFNLIREKVSQITGLKIDEVVVLDLEAVKNIVDQLGGIDVYLEKDVYDPNLVNPKNPSQIFYLESGWRHLDGDLFLKLIRTRYAPEGDFYRMKNQQTMLLALKNKISQLIESWSIISWLQIWQSLSNHYYTTLSLSDLTNLILTFKDLKNYSIENVIIGNTNGIKLLESSGYFDSLGQYVYALIPRAGFENYQEIQKFIFQKIYE